MFSPQRHGRWLPTGVASSAVPGAATNPLFQQAAVAPYAPLREYPSGMICFATPLANGARFARSCAIMQKSLAGPAAADVPYAPYGCAARGVLPLRGRCREAEPLGAIFQQVVASASKSYAVT